ncbi:glycosyltransferase family protein, partial [Aidingimonas lacisalsi]|uniref:hypothetical protein n=1 Tax=Aidingimonas lacisalsi TaxID=2604086 RepID=UPI001F457572
AANRPDISVQSHPGHGDSGLHNGTGPYKRFCYRVVYDGIIFIYRLLMLSPIVIFCYRRGVRRLFDSLLCNSEFLDSEVFVFSDGFKNEEDKQDVINVREQLNEIQKFKILHVHESPHNKGLADSVIHGVSKVIKTYGKVIVLEDDLEVSPFFLTYMNEALDFYRDDMRLWSISGYAPPVLNDMHLRSDVFLFPRGSSWGWATWKDRWDKVDWDVSRFDELKNSKKLKRSFNKGGDDLFKMLELQVLGKIDSWAIRWYFSQFENQMKTLYPAFSLVKNHGFNDGYGTHTTGGYAKWDSEFMISKLNVDCVDESEDVETKMKAYRDISLLTKFGYFTRKYGGYHFFKKIQSLLFRH